MAGSARSTLLLSDRPSLRGPLRGNEKVGVRLRKWNARGAAQVESREPWGTRYRIMGAWRRVLAKHLPAYLDEMTWRFNNRKNPFLFRDTMLKLIHSENLEYKELTKAA